MKDLSIYLTSELMRLLGDPYQSSIATVRRFSRDNFMIFVEYETGADSVRFDAFPRGPLSLELNDALSFLEELQKTIPSANAFRLRKTGNVLELFPEIQFSLSFPRFPEKERISWVSGVVENLLRDLQKMEKIVTKFRAKETAFPEIARLWAKMTAEAEPGEKGKTLEKLLLQLIAIDPDLELFEHNVRTESEEIDVVLQPRMYSPFWSRISPPMIVMECKNWRDKVGAKEVRDFAGKIENRPKLLCRIGFLVAMNGFTEDAEKELLGYRARDFIIATVTGDDIRGLIRTKTRLSKLLQEKLTKAGFR